MVVIRPEREGSSKAEPTLNAPARLRGDDPSQEAAETNRAEGQRLTRRDDTHSGEAEQKLSESARLGGLLQRAGVSNAASASRTDGTVATRAVRPSDDVVKLQAKADELQLRPVSAPRIELTSQLSESALSFAQNIDRAVGNHLVQTAAALGATHIRMDDPDARITFPNTGDAMQRVRDLTGETPRAREPLTTAEADQALAEHHLPVRVLTTTPDPRDDERSIERAAERGLERATESTREPVTGATQTATPVIMTGTGAGVAGNNTATTILNANKPRQKRLTNEALAATPRERGSGTINNARELSPRLKLIDMSNMSSDQMLAEFLKLNINDPNANVETQNKLYTLASEMRQQAIEEAKKKIERAQELMREAQKYADQVEKYAEVASIVGILAAFLGPLGAILSGLMQIAMAVAQYEAQMKILDAKEEKNNAERFKLMGDMHQNQVQETGEIINTIMELKNQMVESVIQMLNASFSTRQQLMSAAMAR